MDKKNVFTNIVFAAEEVRERNIADEEYFFHVFRFSCRHYFEMAWTLKIDIFYLGNLLNLELFFVSMDIHYQQDGKRIFITYLS